MITLSKSGSLIRYYFNYPNYKLFYFGMIGLLELAFIVFLLGFLFGFFKTRSFVIGFLAGVASLILAPVILFVLSIFIVLVFIGLILLIIVLGILFLKTIF